MINNNKNNKNSFYIVCDINYIENLEIKNI